MIKNNSTASLGRNEKDMLIIEETMAEMVNNLRHGRGDYNADY